MSGTTTGAVDAGAQQPPAGFHRILVALDGSDLATAVLPDAIDLARRTNAEVVLASVLPNNLLPASGRGPTNRDALLQHLQAQQDVVVAQHRRVSVVVLHGDPVEQLVSYALGNAIGVIAMATRARWDLDYGFLGSVPDAVLRTSPVPVLLRGGPAAPRDQAVATPPRLLVPLDGSRLAELVLPLAIELAALTGGGVLLLQVIDEPGALDARATVNRNVVTSELRAAHAYLASVMEAWRRPGIALEATVRLGQPAATIFWVALDTGTDLIAMATHGRSGVARERLGSVTQEVLRSNIAPLLVVSAAAQHRKTGTPPLA